MMSQIGQTTPGPWSVHGPVGASHGPEWEGVNRERPRDLDGSDTIVRGCEVGRRGPRTL